MVTPVLRAMERKTLAGAGRSRPERPRATASAPSSFTKKGKSLTSSAQRWRKPAGYMPQDPLAMPCFLALARADRRRSAGVEDDRRAAGMVSTGSRGASAARRLAICCCGWARRRRSASRCARRSARPFPRPQRRRVSRTSLSSAHRGWALKAREQLGTRRASGQPGL